jgi:hypothetical protein
VEELNEQVRDLMFFVEAQKALAKEDNMDNVDKVRGCLFLLHGGCLKL